MSSLAWNCRGLRNRRAVQELVDIVQAQGPKVVFLFEMWSNLEQMKKIKYELEFDGLFVVPSKDRGGGLALLWRSEISIWVDSFSNYHIDAIVNGGTKEAWRLTGFYGEPKTSRRCEGLSMLRMLSSKPRLSWCCIGDFNELLQVGEKKGGTPRSHNLMQAFREAMDACEFVDLGFSGPAFTWHGKRGREWIWERLDRGLANYDWLAKFPTSRVKHLSCFTFDHRPILLSLDADGERQQWSRKPFRFESIWLTNPECGHTVVRAWASTHDGSPMYQTVRKIKKCKKSLKKWSRSHFGNVKKIGRASCRERVFNWV